MDVQFSVCVCVCCWCEGHVFLSLACIWYVLSNFLFTSAYWSCACAVLLLGDTATLSQSLQLTEPICHLSLLSLCRCVFVDVMIKSGIKCGRWGLQHELVIQIKAAISNDKYYLYLGICTYLSVLYCIYMFWSITINILLPGGCKNQGLYD